MLSAVRFAFALVAFLFAILVLISAPALAIWQWKLGATEFGHWLAIFPLLLILGRRRSLMDSLSVILCLLSLGLLLSSAVRAGNFASTARAKIHAAFPIQGDAAREKPFSFQRLWSFGSPAKVEIISRTFSEIDGQALQIDVFAREGVLGAPCLLILHGGSWESGSRTEFAHLNHHWAQRGIIVASMDYRLAPRAIWPAQAQDVRAALGYLRTNAAEFGIDPDRVIIMGRSAGGQIAASVSGDGTLPGVIGCIALYAPIDVQFAFQHAKKDDIVNSDRLLRQYLGGTPADQPENYESASAYLFASEKTPPTLLLHGNTDELVWVQQSHRYAERLQTLGVKNAFLRLPWATHAFDISYNGPGGQFTAWAVERFIRGIIATPGDS
jgi:acetyl esterase/lipase